MKETVESGDVVRLKSGGPLMTVARAGERTIECLFFLGGELAEGPCHSMSLPRHAVTLIAERGEGLSFDRTGRYRLDGPSPSPAA